jgi:chemotaxis protein CheD
MRHAFSKNAIALYMLWPGFIYTPPITSLMAATLGSSVAVCLFDPGQQRGGMNLFKYPVPKSNQAPTARFGNVAIPAKIQMMRAHERCAVQGSEAQIIGGAFRPLTSKRDIGRENVLIAKRLLAQHRIQIISEDVGGEKGRQTQYHTGTNEMAICKSEHIPSENWHPCGSSGL